MCYKRWTYIVTVTLTTVGEDGELHVLTKSMEMTDPKGCTGHYYIKCTKVAQILSEELMNEARAKELRGYRSLTTNITHHVYAM